MKNQYAKKVPIKSLHSEFLKTLNGLLCLSTREMELLALFMDLDSGWKPIIEGDTKNILTTDRRKVLLETTGIAKTNLVKYIKKFRDKGLLIKNAFGGTEVNPIFMPNLVSGIVEVAFTLDTRK